MQVYPVSELTYPVFCLLRIEHSVLEFPGLAFFITLQLPTFATVSDRQLIRGRFFLLLVPTQWQLEVHSFASSSK